MGTIEINTEPIELVIDGTTILMQGDPSATPAWDLLMNVDVSYTKPEKRDEAKRQFTEALTALTATPDDAETFSKLDLGVVTLNNVAMAYAKAVTGFPTQPPEPSTPPSKKTGGR